MRRPAGRTFLDRLDEFGSTRLTEANLGQCIVAMAMGWCGAGVVYVLVTLLMVFLRMFLIEIVGI